MPAADGSAAELARLVELVRLFGAERDLGVLLGKIMEAVRQELSADRASLFLYDRARGELWAKVAQGLDSQEIRFSASEGLAGHTVRTGETLNIPDAYADPRFNREIDRRTGYRTRSVLCVPLVGRDGLVTGAVQALNRLDGSSFDAADAGRLALLAGLAAVAVENALLHEENERLFEGMVEASAQAIEERDPTTSGHSRRVALFAAALARAVHQRAAEFGESYNRDRLRQLRYAALLHDYGKIGVREAVLTKSTKLGVENLGLVAERLRRLSAEAGVPFAGSDGARAEDLVRRTNQPKPLSDADAAELEALRKKGWLTTEECAALSLRRGNLTPAEWADMQSHPERSYRILTRVAWPPRLAQVAELSYAHHEKPSGAGYPRKLPGAEIPFDARVLAVADVYDALTASDRPYKPALPHEKARSIMEDMAAKQELDARLTAQQERLDVVLGALVPWWLGKPCC
jgi:HD-GYP domain-containing protein (c-di-GMP phosphodiesterase class II)